MTAAGMGQVESAGSDAFAASREGFESLVGWLCSDKAAGLAHAELETQLEVTGRESLRRLVQDHLDPRALREQRVGEVRDADGVDRATVEAQAQRTLTTVFGQVTVHRPAYRRRGHGDPYPADAVLNPPAERHSHGLRHLAAVEASRGSFDTAVEAIERNTGVHLGKRQVEELASRAAADVAAFYLTRTPPPGEHTDVLALSVDGKGIVMRADALRPATAKAAAASTTKPATRLSKGEKRNRKTMAEVGAVHDVAPVARTPADVSAGNDHTADRDPAPTPVTANKWLTAGVVEDAAAVVARTFDEAGRRDPTHERTRVALVDGNNHQIGRIHTEAKARGVPVAVLCDFVHVLEYLWKAAWSFHDEGDPAAEQWVHDKAMAILEGKATRVAAGIRRAATRRGLDPPRRAGADTCANYLVDKAPYLDYPTALDNDRPIATGVIEGACRHLVKDRMDLTGARWGLHGAEAILKLRALRSNGDFETYWPYHLAQERQRIHESRYLHGIIPQAA